jgi:hypothetical protein
MTNSARYGGVLQVGSHILAMGWNGPFLHGVIADLAVKPAFEDMRPAAVDLCLEALRAAAQ